MNDFTKNALVGLLALGGFLGSILGIRSLGQAISGCRNLYRVDTIGSQIESDLEYQAQECRSAFFYALAITDPNEQLPYLYQGHSASIQVMNAIQRLRQLPEPDMRGFADEFAQAWAVYHGVHDEIMAHILEGDTTAAIQLERQRGQPDFATVIQKLKLLKSRLKDRARAESLQVDRTLKRSAMGLAAFGLCVLLIMVLLAKANRDRRLALESVHATNAALAEARQMEKQRAAVLEMVSTHASLARTLTEIVEMAPQSNPRVGAAVWAAAGPFLHFQVAANLSSELTAMLKQLLLPRADRTSGPAATLAQHRAAWTGQFGLAFSESKVLQDAGGRVIGFLQLFADGAGARVHPATMAQMAQLAAVGIENTLLYERLAFQAQHDTLTELPNRLLFQDRVQHGLQLARRQSKKIALLWIDLDRYKLINDTLGHRVGDEVLCEVGRRLKNSLRESDTVARVGGDEFTVLAHDVSNASGVERVCRKILSAIAQPMLSSDHAVSVSASIGVSIFPEHGEDPIVLMRNADLAMYMAKRGGGNAYHLFSPSLGDSMQKRLMVEQELKSALEHHELTLHYQPLTDRDGHLAGLEALLRWTNAALGRVSPADFIPIAEEMGFMKEIGEWVIQTACSTGARWLSAGLPLVNIAVNVSPVQFVSKDLAEMVARVLKETGFPPGKLVLEITETALMNNLEQVLEQMGSLRGVGVRFAIDDFGTGYSSLSQLRNLPLDCLKIDRSFVKDLESSDSGSATLVRGIIGLAHSLQLEVVAEGVETDQQLTLLRAMGCDINQGFLLYKPMPEDEVEKLLGAQQGEHTKELSIA